MEDHEEERGDEMQITGYLTVSHNIKIADANDDDSPLASLEFINEAARDLDDAAKLRIGSLLVIAIANELQIAYAQE